MNYLCCSQFFLQSLYLFVPAFHCMLSLPLPFLQLLSEAEISLKAVLVLPRD